MIKFCNLFFTQKPHNIDLCPQCSAVWAKIQQEQEVLDQITGDLYCQTEEEKAGLNCHGRP